ncbi:MAG: hypothetical protein RLZZ26_168 [Candidatus Parcubacteria bacterium]|jgi:hypothetical protein
MDPELKHLVQETLALAKENHRLIKAVRRHQLFETYGKWILWLIVILASVYSFQVYLRPLINTYSKVTGTSATGPFGLPTSADIQKLIDSFKAGK